MVQLYETLKSLVGTKMIGSAAQTLGESESNVQKGVDYLLPALLGRLVKRGPASDIREIVEAAGKADLLGRKEELFEGKGIVDGKNYGERFENAVLGQKDKGFMGAIASKSGLKTDNADRLSNWVCSLIAGFLGQQVVKEKQSLPSLLDGLKHEKDKFMSVFSADMASQLGLGSLKGGDEKKVPAAPAAPSRKKRSGWIWWMIALLLLLLLIWLLSRSCKRDVVTDVATTEIVTEAPASTIAWDSPLRQVSLPSGEEISVYAGGASDRMLEFLSSGAYARATDDELKNTWFSFDFIDFKFNSVSELVEGSYRQLDNIAKILNAFPETNVHIGAFTDKRGTAPVNDAISKARAEYIKAYFAERGVAAQRMEAIGFGEEFATVPSDASDAERARDRNIALRFHR